ncbi:TRAF3-interacting protein 1-like [Oppia nitens]|uniref:TRAF3-interacting protein 1-like n=1 Tax=Oppia nitens TaxID=1686743 RepID=UPI0023DA6CED|nr:TRAF3-interacting protein 1-like [Oppia nitens]
MSSEIDAKLVKQTQELLSKVVKKPVITEKLLRRPPFRFLHDLIISINTNHGFFKDLYSVNDLNAENVKEKEAKIVFLEKAIDTTGLTIGDILSAKPSKIVAGLECDKTNEWLQTMAKAIIDNKDSSDAVIRVLNGEKPTKRNNTVVTNHNMNNTHNSKTNSNNSNNNKKKTLNSQTKSQNNTNKKTKNEMNESKDLKETKATKSEPKNTIKPSVEPKGAKNKKASPLLSTNKTKNISDKQSKPELMTTNASNGSTMELQPTPDSTNSDNREDYINKEMDERPNDIQNNKEVVEQKTSPVRVKTVKPRSQVSALPLNHIQNSETVSTVGPPTRLERSARPSSSRPAPPRVITKTTEDNKIIEAELEEKLRLINAKPVENLITENTTTDDDQEFTVTTDITNDQNDETKEQLNYETNNDIQKGSLVKQLVDTKKELEGNQSSDVPNNDKKITKQTNKDIEKLRQTIQSLSQTASPLAKILDYLQEDIDSMLFELKSWREEYKNNMNLLQKSRTTTLEALEPFKSELNVLDEEILLQMDKISVTKANIIKNDEKLQKMVLIINRL